jgi:hypothetical protein
MEAGTAALVLGIVVVTLVLSIAPSVLLRRAARRRDERIATAGLPAIATVTAVRQLGTQVAIRRRLLVTLELEAAGVEPWMVQKRIYVPRELDLSNAVGVRIPAQFDPDDPRQVVVAWGRRA